MLDSGDWIVPTYNGVLRVEKPPLVNWIQIIGVSLFGRNEFGVRIGSVCLTIGTCLLTWWIGRLLAGPFAGLLSGLVMSTCIWTAVGGRAATPDAALVFCTTMAGAIYIHAIQRDSVLRITRLHAVGIGLACGFAVLAKGPVGIVLPMAAFLLTACVLHNKSIFTLWQILDLSHCNLSPPSHNSCGGYSRRITVVCIGRSAYKRAVDSRLPTHS